MVVLIFSPMIEQAHRRFKFRTRDGMPDQLSVLINDVRLSMQYFYIRIAFDECSIRCQARGQQRTAPKLCAFL